MKNMYIRYAALLLFVLLSASASSFAQTVLEQKINAIFAIKEIRPLETSEFSEKYVTYFTQPLDHRHPEKGSFRQRVIVSHAGFDRPTVIVTEGYGAAYALRSQYREELSKLLNANMIFVEYRYFLESTPEPKDWPDGRKLCRRLTRHHHRIQKHLSGQMDRHRHQQRRTDYPSLPHFLSG